MNKYISKLKYVTQFFPIRWNFFLFVFLIILIRAFVQANQTDSSSFAGILSLLAQIAIWIMCALLLLSLASCIVSWIWFKLKYRKGQSKLNLDLKVGLDKKDQKQLLLNSSLENVFKPLLGNIQARFKFNDYELTDKINLSAKKSNRFLSLTPGASAISNLSLPNIQEYRFQTAFLFFEDLFHFFSLPAQSHLSRQIINLPLTLPTEVQSILPEKANADEIRVPKLRKIDGEWLRYKKYEASDDIRRIVWKVFAKNRELVVRQPEIFNPYASHIELYASFYNGLEGTYLFQDHLQELLNYYKNIIWTWISELKSQDFELKLILDQELKVPATQLDVDAYKISLSKWQQENKPQSFIQKGKGSVVFFHSFMPHKDVVQATEVLSEGTRVCYIKLGKAFHSRVGTAWFRLIFLRPKEDKLSQISNTWGLHPLKSILSKNDTKNIDFLEANINDLNVLS